MSFEEWNKQLEKDVTGFDAWNQSLESTTALAERPDAGEYGSFAGEFGKALVRGSLNVASGMTGTAGESVTFKQPFSRLMDLGAESVPTEPMPPTQLELFLKDVASDIRKTAQKPSLQPSTTEGKGEAVKSFIANAVGETLPFMAAAVLATLAGGPVAGAGVAFAVEGENAYQDAIGAGATEDEANIERLLVGTINAAIEQMQVRGILKFAKKGKGTLKTITKAAKDKALKRLVKAGGKLSKDALMNAINEGLEEALQETVSLTVPALHGRELPPAKKFGKQVGMAGVGGAVAGGILGVGGAALSKTSNRAELQQKLESQTTFSRKDVKELYGLERTTAAERQTLFDEQKQTTVEPVQVPPKPTRAVQTEVTAEGAIGEGKGIIVYQGAEKGDKPTGFVSTSKDFAKDYGKVKKLTITPKNIFNSGNEKHIQLLIDKIGAITDPYDGKTYKTAKGFTDALAGQDTWEAVEQHKETVKRMGFDAIKIYEGGVENYYVPDLAKPAPAAAAQPAPAAKPVGEKIETQVAYHGAAIKKEVFEGSEYFTDSPVEASDYAEMKALETLLETNDEFANIVYDVMAEEGAANFQDLSIETIHNIISANNIDINLKTIGEGGVAKVTLDFKNPVDLTKYGSEAESGKYIKDTWNELYKDGWVDEKWEDLDSEAQFEIEQDYAGRAMYRLFEKENVYSKAFKRGHDAIIFLDQGLGGKTTHKSYLVADKVQIKQPAPAAEVTEEPMASEAPFVRPLPKIGTKARADMEKRRGFLYTKPLETAHRTFLKILQPTKLAEKAVGKGPVAEVLKAIHTPEVKRLEFSEQELVSADKTFGQLREGLAEYPDSVLENVMLTRGHKLEGDARRLQIKAFATLPAELKRADIRRALDEIADFNYKYLQEVVGDDVNKIRDYFYGIYKKPKMVQQFLKYWKTTKRFTQHKTFPTYADAKAYGLEIRNPNPVDNLMSEYSAISYLDAMQNLKDELMRTGKGKYIDEIKNAPPEYATIGEGMPIEPTFSDVRIQPDLARVINNLIAVNKITQIPALNTVRQINNFLRTIKFIGSAFHLLSVGKQSVADSGYLGFYKSTALKGLTRGLRKDDPIFRTPEYRDYIQHGGGHGYAVESEARRAFSGAISQLTRSEKAILKIAGTPLKLPVGFVNWMFRSYIPKVKYAKYLDTVAEKESKSGQLLTSAEKIDIIKEQQNFYGMMNERLFGRSGTVTTLLRFIFMAPGYAEGNFRTVLKAGLQKGADRSRSNIINSWIITGTLATLGTLIFTGKPPEKPKDLDDIRDLFKVDTGKKDKRGQRIMIDLMTYDKDYWNVGFNILRLRPDKALSESVKRIGGMRAPSADLMVDLLKLWRGEALIDWKGDKIYYLTDPFLLKVIKTVKLETERLMPISASVFKQSREREIDKVTAAVKTLLGLRLTRTEEDKREFKIIQDIWSLGEQREKLAYRLSKYDDPMEAVRQYNDTVKEIINSEFVRQRAPELIAKGQKLLIDKEKVVLWSKYPVKKMTISDLRRAIKNNTYKQSTKEHLKGYPHKGKEGRVKELRAELANRIVG